MRGSATRFLRAGRKAARCSPSSSPTFDSSGWGHSRCFSSSASGTAYAANTVFSSDIVDGQVKTADLDGGAVTSEKVAGESLLGRDVFDNTLKGADMTSRRCPASAAAALRAVT